MSVIIRLQNLPWSANALDIRQFFSGLSIPEGGVHIVGGELGDAFIAFSTDEDARQAFNINGGKIKEVQVKLMLSSRTEMQKVIEAARNPLAAFMQRTPTLPTAVPQIQQSIVSDLGKKSEKEKDRRERRRSRSRSRDRRDRSRERDSRERDRRERRRRDRSRSRSRDRRERRRRDRSRSKDRRLSKERKSEERSVPNNKSPVLLQNDSNQAVVWTNNVPVVQTPSILSSILPTHLQQSNLLLNYRNTLQNSANALNLSRVVNAWNNISNLSERRPELTTCSFQDDLKAVSNILGVSSRNGNFEKDSGFNRSGSHRVSRFDSPYEKSSLSQLPPTLKGPHPLDRLVGDDKDFVDQPSYERSLRSDKYERPIMKDCCIELKPYYGGYGEVRKFFNGIFIPNNGIKFVNDEFGKRTGVVYVRFASPMGKQRGIQKNGMLLRGFNMELEDVSDNVFEEAIDRYFPPQFNERNSNNDFRRSSEFPSDRVCLAIEDLPLFTNEQDMLKIFSDYPLQRIILENKQRHTIAYLKFATSNDAQKAAKERDGYHFDNKPLKIRSCSDEEYNIISLEQDDVELLDDDDDDKPLISVDTDCVSLSGLPMKTTDRDVSDFFSDVAIVPKKIHLISSNIGFIGQAYCEFQVKEDAQTALQKNGLPLGSGVVKVKPISRSEMEENIGLAIPRVPAEKHKLSKQSILDTNDKSSVIFEQSKFDKCNKLVSDKNYKPSKTNDSYEKPTNSEPPNKIYKKPSNDENYEMQNDDRNHEIPDVNKNKPLVEKQQLELAIDKPQIQVFEPPTDQSSPELKNAEISNENIKFEPPEQKFEPPHEARQFEPQFENRIFEPPYERKFEPSRKFDANLELRNRPFELNARLFEQSAGPRSFNPLLNAKRNFEPRMPVTQPRLMPPPLMGFNRPPLRRLPPSVNPTEMAEPGCTVLMENVPYKAGLEEILGFFEGFEVNADNVLRRYNDNGTPSGEAKVIFNSQDEAFRALQECNLQKIRERTIYLSQC